MEQIDRTEQHQRQIDKDDYIDIPKFIKTMVRFAFKYLYLVLPLILIMTACMAMLSKVLVKKKYTAGGTFLIGVQLEGASSYHYTFSEYPGIANYALSRATAIFSGIITSEYMDKLVREELNLGSAGEINGAISFDIPYGTNMAGIFVESDSLEDAKAIRHAVFTHLPDLVYSSMGYVELDIKEWYTREEDSPRKILANPAVWIIGGLFLGGGAYLGLIFIYALFHMGIETPEDVQDAVKLPCLGHLPALRPARLLSRRKNDYENSLVMTKTYKEAFAVFRRSLSDQIRSGNVKTLLFTGSDRQSGQSLIIDRLKTIWTGQGKNVIVTALSPEYGPGMEEELRSSLDTMLEKADLVLIDGASCREAADSVVLADLVDAVVLVVKEGHTRTVDMKKMVQSMEFARGHILGFVINGCDFVPFYS